MSDQPPQSIPAALFQKSHIGVVDRVDLRAMHDSVPSGLDSPQRSDGVLADCRISRWTHARKTAAHLVVPVAFPDAGDEFSELPQDEDRKVIAMLIQRERVPP
jgi:hypothetical protein